MKKSPIIAFLLAFFPGGGLLYLGKILRGLFYTGVVLGSPIVAVGAVAITGAQIFLAFSAVGLLMYIINLIDTAVTASKLYSGSEAGSEQPVSGTMDSERFFAIVLSFVPGLGHFQLGLIYRGITLLAVFMGLGAMVLFVSMMTGRSEFLVFLLTLPIIWLYGFFDVMQLLKRKEEGEVLEDRSALEEFENKRPGGKSKSIATLLSIVPGVGHLYLGLQKRGIQLLAAFLFSIYILDMLRLGIFLFLVPIIWFYSFFDGLQKASQYEEGTVEDEPIVSYLINHQKWLGIGLILLGIYYMGTILITPFADYLAQEYALEISSWLHMYIQPAIVCLLLIVGGVKLMTGKKTNVNKEEETE